MDTLIANFSTLSVAPEARVAEMSTDRSIWSNTTSHATRNNAPSSQSNTTFSTYTINSTTSVTTWHPIFHHIQPCGMSDHDYHDLCVAIHHKNITIEEILQRTNIDFARTLFNNGFFTDEEIHTFIRVYTGVDPRIILHLFYVADVNECQKFLVPYYENIIYTLYKIINAFIDPNTADIIKILHWFVHRVIYPNNAILGFMIKKNEIEIVSWILRSDWFVRVTDGAHKNCDPFMWIDDTSDHSMITTLLQHGYYPSQEFFDHIDDFMYDYIVNFHHHGGD